MPNFNTKTENAPWIPEIIANEALGLLGAYLNLGKTVAKDSDLAPSTVGQVINIPRRGTVTALQKGQNSPTTVQKPLADKVQVTIDQHWYVKIGEEDFTEAFQTNSTLPGYVEDSVIVLAEKIESNLATRIASFPNIDAGNSDGDAYKGVVNIKKEQSRLKVPQLAERFGYVSPAFYARLLKETAIIDPKVQTNQTARESAKLPSVAGYGLFEGQLTPTAGSPAWDQNFFYTRNALVLASRPLRQPSSSLGVDATTVQSEAGLALRLVRYYDKDEMAEVFQLDTLFGSGVNDVRLGYVLESLSTV